MREARLKAPAGAADLKADVCWEAVRSRDPAFHDRFVYCVRTTGVFCRPTCASRVPNRANVVFFADWRAAERAGFRACRRCHPGAKAEAGAHVEAIVAACRRLEASEETVGLAELAAAAGMSRFHFQRVFKATTGLTPKSYERAQRAARMREALAGRTSVTEAIYAAGFASSSRFYERSDEILGMTARAFQKGGKGVAIQFAIGRCSLGSILVACSEKGICAISLGDDPDRLESDLRNRFARASIFAAESGLQSLLDKAIALVETPSRGLELPLDIQGTAFQQRVWTALREIPAGETISYSELARRIGAPRAVRAVAGACASNRIAVAIPCHRVVSVDGSISGYRWGVERKRALLRREARAPKALDQAK